MLRGLFGFNKGQSSAIPKNHIEVVCPTCGAAQYEPRLVVSTFCKRCGVHLRMEKKKVIASEVSKAGGQPDALSSAPMRADTSPPVRQRMAAAGPSAASGPMGSNSFTPLPNSTSRRPITPTATPIPAAAAFTDADTGELGLGMMLQGVAPAAIHQFSAPAVQETDEDLIPGNEPEEAIVEPVPVEVEPETAPSVLSTANPGPMSAGTLQKMKDQGFYRQQYFKDAQCFDCDHKFKVARSSRSANCPNCGAYIGMEDVELNMPSSQAIKTRGDVLIRKRGQLTAAHLYCRELRCFGQVSANIFCTGDAIFRTSGTIVGEIHCRRFIVEKGSEITFMNPVHAEEAEIQAPITGHVFSKGPLLISANGAVNGNVTARSVSIEPGGELNGAMNIVRSAAPAVVPAATS